MAIYRSSCIARHPHDLIVHAGLRGRLMLSWFAALYAVIALYGVGSIRALVEGRSGPGASLFVLITLTSSGFLWSRRGVRRAAAAAPDATQRWQRLARGVRRHLRLRRMWSAIGTELRRRAAEGRSS